MKQKNMCVHLFLCVCKAPNKSLIQRILVELFITMYTAFAYTSRTFKECSIVIPYQLGAFKGIIFYSRALIFVALSLENVNLSIRFFRLPNKTQEKLSGFSRLWLKIYRDDTHKHLINSNELQSCSKSSVLLLEKAFL